MMSDSETKSKEEKKSTPKKVAKTPAQKKAKDKAKNNIKQSELRCRLYDACIDMVKAKMKRDPKTSKATIQNMIEKKYPQFDFFIIVSSLS